MEAMREYSKISECRSRRGVHSRFSRTRTKLRTVSRVEVKALKPLSGHRALTAPHRACQVRAGHDSLSREREANKTNSNTSAHPIIQ